MVSKWKETTFYRAAYKSISRCKLQSCRIIQNLASVKCTHIVGSYLLPP